MTQYLTIAEAQQKLPDLTNELTTEPAIITQDGKPVLIALSFTQFSSLLETLEILADQEFMIQLRQGIEQADKGETITLEALEAELGL